MGRGVRIENCKRTEGEFISNNFVPLRAGGYNGSSNKWGGYFPGLGRINRDGEIRDENGRLVGRINEDGEVWDGNGRKKEIYDDGEVREAKLEKCIMMEIFMMQMEIN